MSNNKEKLHATYQLMFEDAEGHPACLSLKVKDQLPGAELTMIRNYEPTKIYIEQSEIMNCARHLRGLAQAIEGHYLSIDSHKNIDERRG